VRSSKTSANHISVHDRFERFWERFYPHTPTFAGKAVLDVGCGEGNRCFEAAAKGASRVVGVDPSWEISIARARLKNTPVHERERIVFFEGLLPVLPPERFDLIVSEDTFEHVLDVPELLAEVRKRLSPGGQFYLGFGPLYHSFDGDHGWMRAVLPGRKFFPWPWGHLIFEKYALRKLSKLHAKQITNTRDWPYLSLNRHTFAEYEAMFRESGLRIAYSRVNYVRSLKGKLFAALAGVPGLSRYFTMNVYMILEHDHEQNPA
jgi:SAM-dependent methyltransferase